MSDASGSNLPRVAVLDYGIGNLRSAQKGLEHAGAIAELTTDRDTIMAADGVVLPGVGNFGRCMEALHATGLAEVAVDVAASGQPFIGICVGMQLLYEGSEEAPDSPGLGILKGQVRLLSDDVKRPQMQWNQLRTVQEHPMLEGLDGAWMYFVHSYAAESSDDVVATCDYGGEVPAAAGRDNVWATQFHPEKSSLSGRRLLKNFVSSLTDGTRS